MLVCLLPGVFTLTSVPLVTTKKRQRIKKIIYDVLPCSLNGGVLERCKSLTTRRLYILRLGCLPLTADFTIMCPFEWEAEMLGTGFSTSGLQKVMGIHLGCSDLA